MRAVPCDGFFSDTTTCNLSGRLFSFQGIDGTILIITELFLADSIGQSFAYVELPTPVLRIRNTRSSDNSSSSNSESDAHVQEQLLYRLAEDDDLSMSMTAFRGKLLVLATIFRTGELMFCLLVEPPSPAGVGAGPSFLDYTVARVATPTTLPFVVNFTPLDDTLLFASAGIGRTDFLFDFDGQSFTVRPLPFMLLNGRNANLVCPRRQDGTLVVVGGLTEVESCVTRNDPEGLRHADVILVNPRTGEQSVACAIPVGPRSAPGVTLLMDRFVLAFGGYNGVEDCSEMFICDLDSGMSSIVRQTRTWPPKAFSSAVVVRRRRLYVLSQEFQGRGFYISLVDIWRNIDYAPLREVFWNCLSAGWKSAEAPWMSVPKLRPGVRWMSLALNRAKLDALSESGPAWL